MFFVVQVYCNIIFYVVNNELIIVERYWIRLV